MDEPTNPINQNPNPPSPPYNISQDTLIIKPPSKKLSLPGNFKKMLPIITLIILMGGAVLGGVAIRERQAPKKAEVYPTCPCERIKVYDQDWKEIASKDIKPDKSYHFSASARLLSPGYIYAGMFRVNSHANADWCKGEGRKVVNDWCFTQARKPNSNEFYITYRIPAAGGTFTVEATLWCEREPEITPRPTIGPTSRPTAIPTETEIPTPSPTIPSYKPTRTPTLRPTAVPTNIPTIRPTTSCFNNGSEWVCQ